MKHFLAICLLALACACHHNDAPPAENFECTLFMTEHIPAAEDFPAYLACWSDQGRVVFLWWHEVSDILSTMGEAEIAEYRLPNEWFDEETGAFDPSCFWPELGIIHEIDGIHDPCSIPELVEYADLECFDVMTQEEADEWDVRHDGRHDHKDHGGGDD
jgi:hypothetical protein